MGQGCRGLKTWGLGRPQSASTQDLRAEEQGDLRQTGADGAGPGTRGGTRSGAGGQVGRPRQGNTEVRPNQLEQERGRFAWKWTPRPGMWTTVRPGHASKSKSHAPQMGSERERERCVCVCVYTTRQRGEKTPCWLFRILVCLCVTLQEERVALGKCASISLLNWFCLLVRARPRSPERVSRLSVLCVFGTRSVHNSGLAGAGCLPARLSRQKAFDCSFRGVWHSEPNGGLISLHFGLRGWMGGPPGLCVRGCVCVWGVGLVPCVTESGCALGAVLS